MKSFIISAFIGLTMLAFTGCTKNGTAEAEAKCSASSKCEGATKCSGDTSKAVTTKCDASKKCG
ncbi:hypothetical protein MN086_10535 [Sulfurovum sp. XGS-02]|uniref:hypothetical protein n=1 Tax=Sulfurovum sp. XGS-02 TaxID=2925411 RepID=UPI00205FB911|nr:hypothetical protein [Sulfurovum sp. XGS-02]UPT77470.1 hypothetical protein MN086_10535 [Sulfurovum sp. XGS-02]